jgi:hypothetical protein
MNTGCAKGACVKRDEKNEKPAGSGKTRRKSREAAENGGPAMKKSSKMKTLLVLALVSALLWPVCALGATDYTAASETVQSDDAIGRAWAQYIVEAAGAKTQTEKIRAICAWYADNMEYDKEFVLRVRDLSAVEQARRMPRYDYLSTLAAAADYAAGRSKTKPKVLCGNYAHGAAGSLRALGIPVKIEKGKVSRTVRKGEAYLDANGDRRVSRGGGETPYRYFAGRWIKITDMHVRLSVWDETAGRWISADPAFISISGDEASFDMSAEKYAERWTFLYISSERAPRVWGESPAPKWEIAPPPAPAGGTGASRSG